MPEENWIDAMPAKRLQAMLPALLRTFFPEGHRQRFEAVAAKFERKDPNEWAARFALQRGALEELIAKLQSHLDVPDWDLVFLGIDEELLLFYILKLQSAAIRVAQLPPEAWVPGHMEQTWHWMMDLHPKEEWLHWTFLLRGRMETLAKPLPIWRMVQPKT